MIDGAAGPRQFTDEAVRRADVVVLRDRIHAEADPTVSHSQAVATARLRDGSSVTVNVEAASGTPENPLSAADLRAKFDDLVEPKLGANRCAELAGELTRLEAHERLDGLLEATVRQPHARP
jgi:2-methylcitrate dehydratase PrpD